MEDIIKDALPEVLAFMLIGVLAFVGWSVRRAFKLVNDVNKLLKRETTNGGDSTKDLIRRFAAAQEEILAELKKHNKWAQEDAGRMHQQLTKALGEEPDNV